MIINLNELSESDKINKLINRCVENINFAKIIFPNNKLSTNELIKFFKKNNSIITHITTTALFSFNDKHLVVYTVLLHNLLDNININLDTQSIIFYDISKTNSGYNLKIYIYDDDIKMLKYNRNEVLNNILNEKNHSK